MNLNYQEALNKIISKTSDWLETAITMLPNLAVAILLVVLFYFLARLSRFGLKKLNNRFHGNSSIMRLVGNVIFAIILCIGIFVALSVLQLDKAVTSLLAGAGIIGLALGFAFQETASNFLAGIIMTFKKPFRHGDMIKTNDITGIVQELSLRSTLVRTFQGEDVIIPNKMIFYNPIFNYNSFPKRRIDLKARVSYRDDLEKVRDIATEALSTIPSRDEEREIKIWYEEFAESSVYFTAAVWINFTSKSNYRDSFSAAVMNLKKAFEENDITIPFPIRTVHLGPDRNGEAEKLNLLQSSDNDLKSPERKGTENSDFGTSS